MASPFEKAFLASAAKAPNLFEMFESRRREKERERAAIAAEGRATVRAAEAKVQSSLEALEKRDKETMGDALVARDISTIPSDEQLPSMRFTGADVEGEAYRQLTPMEAVRSRMPQGEPDTIENVRAQQSYLAGIAGAERIAAAEPEAFAKAGLTARANIEAQEEISDKKSTLLVKEWLKTQAEYRKEEAAFKVGEDAVASAKRRIKHRGRGGESYDDALKSVVRGRVPTAVEKEALYDSWAEGSITYDQTSSAGKLAMAEAQAEADIKAGRAPVNPFSPVDDKKRHDHFAEFVKLARMDNPIKKQEALEAHTARGVKLAREREQDVKYVESSEPEWVAAQKQFDKWVDSWFPAPSGSTRRPTSRQITIEAISRGVNPATALAPWAVRTLPSNRKKFRSDNYEIFNKHNRNFFKEAIAYEVQDYTKPVHYSMGAGSFPTIKATRLREEDEQLKKDTATAVRLLDKHNGDLSAIAAAGVSPFVFKIAEDVVHRVGAEAASRVLGDKKTAGMKFEEALKFMNLPANTAYITEPLPSGEPETIVINSATGPKVVEIFYGTRFHPNLGRNLTPAEIKAAKDEKKQRSGFSRNNALSKKMGFDVWDIVK